MLPELFHRLLTIGRLRDQVHIRLRRDQASDTVADNRVVVYAEEPDHKLTLSFGEIAASLARRMSYCKQSSL